MKRNRNSLKYRIWVWWFRLTKKDIYNFLKMIFNFVGATIAALMIFIFLFVFPAIFH